MNFSFCILFRNEKKKRLVCRYTSKWQKYRTQVSVVKFYKTCSTFLLQSRFCLAAACYTIYVFLLEFDKHIYIYFVKCSILFHPKRQGMTKQNLYGRMVFICNIIAKLSLLYYKKVYERKFMCLLVEFSHNVPFFLFYFLINNKRFLMKRVRKRKAHYIFFLKAFCENLFLISFTFEQKLFYTSN